jgi:hypothetical protein
MLEHFFETRSMDTNSNNISSSNYCFLFEKCAREGGCQGASGHGHNQLFETRGHLFLGAIFGTVFFSKLVPNGTPNGIKNQRKSQKNKLGTKPTKHIENVLILKFSDFQETRFQMEWLSKITKARGADKYKKISKTCVEMKPKSMKNRPRNSRKNDA